MKRTILLLLLPLILLAACTSPAEEQDVATGDKGVIVEVFRPPT